MEPGSPCQRFPATYARTGSDRTSREAREPRARQWLAPHHEEVAEGESRAAADLDDARRVERPGWVRAPARAHVRADPGARRRDADTGRDDHHSPACEEFDMDAEAARRPCAAQRAERASLQHACRCSRGVVARADTYGRGKGSPASLGPHRIQQSLRIRRPLRLSSPCSDISPGPSKPRAMLFAMRRRADRVSGAPRTLGSPRVVLLFASSIAAPPSLESRWSWPRS